LNPELHGDRLVISSLSCANEFTALVDTTGAIVWHMTVKSTECTVDPQLQA